MLPEARPGPAARSTPSGISPATAPRCCGTSSTGISAGWTPPIWCAAPSRCCEYPMVDRDVLPGGDAAASRCSAMPPIRCIPLAPTAVRRPSSMPRCSPTSCRATSRTACARYEDRRRPETAEVVEANREMHRTGATQRPEDLARVTTKYRNTTPRGADRESAHDHLRAHPRRLPRRMVLRRSRRRPAIAGPPGAGHHADRGSPNARTCCTAAVNLDTHITDVLAAIGPHTDVKRCGAGRAQLRRHGHHRCRRPRFPKRSTHWCISTRWSPTTANRVGISSTTSERQWYLDVDDTGYGVPPMPFFDPRATAHPLAIVPPADQADRRPEQVPASRLRLCAEVAGRFAAAAVVRTGP